MRVNEGSRDNLTPQKRNQTVSLTIIQAKPAYVGRRRHRSPYRPVLGRSEPSAACIQPNRAHSGLLSELLAELIDHRASSYSQGSA